MTNKIELPIQVDEPTPTKWDWKRLIEIGISLFFLIWFVVWSSYLFSKFIITKIDIETEKQLFANNDNFEWEKIDISKYIDYQIPEFKKYDIYLTNSEEVNAYAWLGAKIYLTKGLLENLDNQEELAFIIAHEIWHIKHRDVLTHLANTLSIKLSLYFMAMYLWFDFGTLENYENFWENIYSKNVELEADKYAINLLKKYNINLACVIPFFQKYNNPLYNNFTLLSDHPLIKTRIKLLEENIDSTTENKTCKKLQNN